MAELILDKAEFKTVIEELVPEYQRAIVLKALDLESTSEADFDEIGLSITGEKRQSSLMLYAGVPNQGRTGVWVHVKAELYEYLCTSSKKYTQERNEGSATLKNVITVVATAIASSFNVAVGVVVGAVTIALLSALKIGKNAWCEANKSAAAL